MIRPLLIVLLTAAAPAAAQSVAGHYHRAAQLYIGGENAQAEAAAEAGLALAPNDAKLRALLEKIREKNPQQGGSEQSAQDEGDEQQPGESGQPQPDQQGQPQDDAQDEGAEPDEQDEGPAEGEPQDAPPEEDPQEQRKSGSSGAEGEQDPNAPGGQQLVQGGEPGGMSRAEAERILQAIEADELELLRDVQRRRARPRFVEKDW
ncbi:MAG: hypothetical protein R3362_09325 [Rhodothermales bacterium]|nr:hypothetical protein [Rhodothermales bacterium]